MNSQFLATTTADLSKLSNVVKNDVLKRLYLMNWLNNAINTIDTRDLVKKADYNTKSEEIEKEITDHDKCITPKEFNKLTKKILDEDYASKISNKSTSC